MTEPTAREALLSLAAEFEEMADLSGASEYDFAQITSGVLKEAAQLARRRAHGLPGEPASTAPVSPDGSSGSEALEAAVDAAEQCLLDLLGSCPLSASDIRTAAVVAARAAYRVTARAIFRDVWQLVGDYTDPDRDIIAWLPFSATLDQFIIERYGLPEAAS